VLNPAPVRALRTMPMVYKPESGYLDSRTDRETFFKSDWVEGCSNPDVYIKGYPMYYPYRNTSCRKTPLFDTYAQVTAVSADKQMPARTLTELRTDLFSDELARAGLSMTSSDGGMNGGFRLRVEVNLKSARNCPGPAWLDQLPFPPPSFQANIRIRSMLRACTLSPA
jgi:hypothetical protein